MKRLLLIVALLLPVSARAGGLMMSSGTPPVAAGGACTWSVAWDAETVSGDTTWSDWLNTAGRNNRYYILSADTINGSGDTIRMTFRSHSSTADTISDVSIGPKKASADPYDFDSAPTNITFGSVDAASMPGSGGTVTSDAIGFTFNTGNDYILAFFYQANTYVSYLSFTASGAHGSNPSDESETVDVSSYSQQDYVESLYSIEVCN